MATKRRSPIKPIADCQVEEHGLLAFVEDQMRIYGKETNLERAIPDFRDGMKPVTRRLLYALSNLPKAQLMKSARLVGEVIGKFHPHGDSSILGALSTLVNYATPPIDGTGNWGTLIDPPAAMRYTNVTMSKYGALFFGKHYAPVVPYVPSYDGKDKEPLVLASLLPNLLFNGTNGIGVGVRTCIPAFTPQSVLKTMLRLLDGDQLTTRDYVKGLEFYYQYGGKPKKTKENFKLISDFFESTKGSVLWESDISVEREQKRIVFEKFAPGINPITFIDDKVKPLAQVARAYQARGLTYIIEARKDLNFVEFDKLVDLIKKMSSSRESYEVYVTERKELEGSEGKYEVDFFTCSIPDLITKWIKWRVKLEATSLDYQIGLTEKDIAYLELLIYACDHLDVIFKALRTPDPAAGIVKGLKITVEQANQILDLKVRQLSKLDQDALKDRLKAAQDHLGVLKAKRKKPSAQVRNFLAAALNRVEDYTRFSGTYQFRLATPTKEKVEQ